MEIFEHQLLLLCIINSFLVVTVKDYLAQTSQNSHGFVFLTYSSKLDAYYSSKGQIFLLFQEKYIQQVVIFQYSVTGYIYTEIRTGHFRGFQASSEECS